MKVDANFGKPQENADKFKDMTACIKIGGSKKRTHNEMINGSSNGVDQLQQSNDNNNKKMKLNDGVASNISVKEATTSGSNDKENANSN